MLMYHGTVSVYLSPIKLFGLMPSPKNSWKIRGVIGKLHEESQAVYLTENEHHAASYAESKVKYLETEPGGVFQLYGDLGGIMRKDDDAPVIKNARPVVLVIEVDENDHRLMIDPEDSLAYEYRGPLPPSAVRDVKSIVMPNSAEDDPIRYEAEANEKAQEEAFAAGLRRMLFSVGRRRDPSPFGDSPSGSYA